MKRLVPPPFNDHQAIQNLARNRRLKSYDELLNNLPPILGAYTSYATANGNAEAITSINLPATLKEKLEYHYSKPPAELAILSEIRDALSPDVCPMCGGFSPGTLDHVLPRESYSEFSVCVMNLVPACKCNSLRQSICKRNVGERVLHPYYDTILSERIMRAEFSGTPPMPTGVRICYTGANAAAVAFHVEVVVMRTNILFYLAKEWAKVLRIPFEMFPELRGTPLFTLANLTQFVSDAAHRVDSEFGTPNNWKSVLFSGIHSSPEAMNYLLVQLNGITNGNVIAADI